MKNNITLFFLCVGISCSVSIMPGVRFSPEDVYNRNVATFEAPEQSTHAEKKSEHSICRKNTQSDIIKNQENKLEDIVIKDGIPKASDVNERSFVYLKTKNRTPIINTVPGSSDLGVVHVNKGYLRDLAIRQNHDYIEKFLRHIPFFDVNSRNIVRAKTNKWYSNKDNREAEKSHLDYEKLKFVEFLKPPLVRCEHDKGENSENGDATHTDFGGQYESPIYPINPPRIHHYFPVKYEYTHSDKMPEKDTLCSHILHSYIKDCVRNFLDKNANESAMRILSNCLRGL